ncbi:MAG: hypothetical protein Q9191_004348 [Dirinaria sp. TL-2023a]
MATTTNGVQSPSSIGNANQSSITGKRKRSDNHEEVDGDIQPPQHDPDRLDIKASQLNSLLQDIVTLLENHDTSPSTLNRPVTSTIEHEHSPSAKKTKLSETSKETTVASLVAAGAYTTIDQFLADMETALKEVAEALKGSPEMETMTAGVTAFKAELENLLWTEMVMRPKLLASKSSTQGLDSKNEPESPQTSSSQNDAGNPQSAARTVLTLFGSAPHPRQLFSSFQLPVPGQDIDSLYDRGQSPSMPAIREAALPNGISTTTIIPIHSADVDPHKRKEQTLGELLPQPPSLAHLNPPRQSKHTATRSSSVNWFNPSDSLPSSRSYRRDNFVTQPLTTGQWLAYNVPPSAAKMSSPEAKRKQRDRALSFGESQTALPQETIDAHNQAKEDALFRSAFSSFAPNSDYTGSIVNARAKNRVWWEKFGEPKYESALAMTDYEMLDESEVVDGETELDADRELRLFEEAVASWDGEELPSELKESEKQIRDPQTTQEIDEILREISEALETLNSHQRVRNLSLTTSARATAGQNPQLTATSKSPTSPSADEFDIYEILRSHLALMVSQLPPFALARLDGDKLSALNVSTKIQVPGKVYKGSMEEDEISAKARQASNAAVYPATANATSGIPARSSVYASTPNQPVRSSYTAQHPASRQSSSYLPNQQYSSRPITTTQYLGNASSSYATQQRTPMASERYSYTASQQYGQRPSQSSQSSYTNGYRSYSGQNGGSYGQHYSTPTQGTTPTQRPTQPGYQQRAANSQTYSYSTASAGKSGSPAQNASAYTPQQRSSYAANNAQASPHRPSMYQSHSSQYSSHNSSTANANGASSDKSPSHSTYMTANDQAALMNRQKAQLAERQSHPPNRQASGTPQPANGTYAGQTAGTPPPQTNGIAASQGK